MRDLFKGYYLPTADEVRAIWRDGLIVLDANILLALYDVQPASADVLLDALAARQEQLWLPYQVALEVHNNVHGLRAKQTKAHKERIETVESLLNQIRSTAKKSRFRNTQIQTTAVEGLEEWLHELKEEREDITKNTDHRKPDELLGKISALFEGHVGTKPTKSDLKALFAEGAERFKEKLPPGFEDEKDKSGNDKYGDFVLWRQILDHATASKRDVIFVTDDNKSDWWLKVEAMGKTSLVPRPELIQEFREETGQEIIILNSREFYYVLTPTGEDAERNAKTVAARNDVQDAVSDTRTADERRARTLRTTWFEQAMGTGRFARSNAKSDGWQKRLRNLRNVLVHTPIHYPSHLPDYNEIVTYTQNALAILDAWRDSELPMPDGFHDVLVRGVETIEATYSGAANLDVLDSWNREVEPILSLLLSILLNQED